MKVFMNIESLMGPRTGIGYYTQHLISGLLSGENSTEVHGVLKGQIISPDGIQGYLSESHDVSEANRASFTSRFKPLAQSIPGAYWAREQYRSYRLSKAKSEMAGGVYHEPSFIPAMNGKPSVITVHDLSHLRFPEHHPKERVRFLNKELPKALMAARQIITVSDFTKNELCHFFPEVETKTTAIHLGVEDDFRVRSWRETSDVLLPMGLMHGTYILAAATQEPRKNLAGLVRSYLKLPLHIRKQTPLVLVGGSGWKSKTLLKALADARQEDSRVIVTGRVSRYALTNLMSGARLFAYPSFYEGFGLPIAEARASGVPVLTSNHGAMKEVAGNDAILVDPNDFVEPMKVFLEAPNYEVEPFRFDWSETASKTADVYRNTFI